MSWHARMLSGAVAGLALVATAFSTRADDLGSDVSTNYQAMADGAKWGWSDERATPLYGCSQAGETYDLRIVSDHRDRSRLRIEVWDGDRLAHAWAGHIGSVFRIVGHQLYYADYNPNSTGGMIIAIDLKTGTERWRSALIALGPIEHSSYSNRVNLDVGNEVITVCGLESLGRYFESKLIKDGKTVGQKIFPKAP